ncbi:hypothetical protein ACI78T_11790 [Blastococcus sp. SYSU D00922]
MTVLVDVVVIGTEGWSPVLLPLLGPLAASLAVLSPSATRWTAGYQPAPRWAS